MSVKDKHEIYNKNIIEFNELTLCDFFSKLSINDNDNKNNQQTIDKKSSSDTIQSSIQYINDYISISSETHHNFYSITSTETTVSYNENKNINIEEKDKYNHISKNITYPKTNYSWSRLINYLIKKEPYN
jgi:hypothetical protein